MRMGKLLLGLLVISGYAISSAYSLKYDLNDCSTVNATKSDSLSQWELLQSKKWVELLEDGTVEDEWTFTETEAEQITYWDGEVVRGVKDNYYLSDTPDKVFDSKKLKTKNGKYMVFKSDYFPGTYDDTEVYEIKMLTSSILRMDYVHLHDEAIAGGSLKKMLIGREKE